jgi:hypothetical protein
MCWPIFASRFRDPPNGLKAQIYTIQSRARAAIVRVLFGWTARARDAALP